MTVQNEFQHGSEADGSVVLVKVECIVRRKRNNQ